MADCLFLLAGMADPLVFIADRLFLFFGITDRLFLIFGMLLLVRLMLLDAGKNSTSTLRATIAVYPFALVPLPSIVLVRVSVTCWFAHLSFHHVAGLADLLFLLVMLLGGVVGVLVVKLKFSLMMFFLVIGLFLHVLYSFLVLMLFFVMTGLLRFLDS